MKNTITRTKTAMQIADLINAAKNSDKYGVKEVTKIGASYLGIFNSDGTAVIDIEPYLDDIEKGDTTVTVAAMSIMENLDDMNENMPYEVKEIASDFMSSEGVLKNVQFQLISDKYNETILKSVPHLKYLDLYLVFRVIKGDYSALVTNGMMESVGLTLNQLRDAAQSNLSTTDFDAMDLAAMMFGFTGGDIDSYDGENIGTWVITSKSRMYGATAMLKANLLKGIATKTKRNLFILPSSIHEIMAMPDDGTQNAHNLKDLVMSINATEVSHQDYLSDSIYYYNADTDAITVVA